MLPLVSVCCQVFNFKPHKKKITIKMISRSFEKSFKNYRPIFLVKVVQNASGEKLRRKRKQYIPPIAVTQQTPVYSRPGLICFTIFLIRSLKWETHNKENRWYTNKKAGWVRKFSNEPREIYSVNFLSLCSLIGCGNLLYPLNQSDIDLMKIVSPIRKI